MILPTIFGACIFGAVIVILYLKAKAVLRGL